MSGGFLSSIARDRRERTLRESQLRPTAELRAQAEARRDESRPFVARLRRPAGEPLRVIAEVKRASPSAGVLRDDYDPAGIAASYLSAGAAAISVLTEPTRFQGSIEHLAQVRKATHAPILCKDFVVHERQVYEARAAGADAILLIVALLDRSQLRDYAMLATEVGLDLLIEAFDESELERALALEGAVGVNNRDLRTLSVVPDRAARLLARVPAERVRVAESGYRTREAIEELTRLGIDAVLIGETLLRAGSIDEAFHELFGDTLRRSGES